MWISHTNKCSFVFFSIYCDCFCQHFAVRGIYLSGVGKQGKIHVHCYFFYQLVLRMQFQDIRCFRVFTYIQSLPAPCIFVNVIVVAILSIISSVIISFCLNLVQIYILLMLYKFEPIFCYGTYSLGNILLVIQCCIIGIIYN